MRRGWDFTADGIGTGMVYGIGEDAAALLQTDTDGSLVTAPNCTLHGPWPFTGLRWPLVLWVYGCPRNSGATAVLICSY